MTTQSRAPALLLLGLTMLVSSGQGCVVVSRCDAEPACGPGETEVESCPKGADCETVEVCGEEIVCMAPQCEAAPHCDVGYEEVAACSGAGDCKEVSLCGSTILCEQTAQCLAEPSCDPGDVEVTGDCPSTCYSVTACGSTILCEDAFPQHGCPAEEPLFGGACDPEGTPSECHYPPCGFYACELTGDVFTWVVTGGCAAR